MYILNLGPGESMPGGMLGVIHDIMSADMPRIEAKRIHIPTASKTHKIVTFAVALVRVFILCLLNRVVIAHIHMSERGSVKRTRIFLKLFHRFGVKTIVHSHGGMIRDQYDKFSDDEKKRLSDDLSLADIFIVLTEGWSKFWKRVVDEERIRIIPNGVPIPDDADREYRIGDRLNILYMGYISQNKGTFDLIEALSLIREEGTRFHATIAGNGETDKCKALIKEYNLSEFADVVGWVDGGEKVRLYKTHDVLVLPSYYESFGIAAIEAMAWKMPVVCGDRGYTREVIMENETGYVARCGDIKDIACYILKLETEEHLKSFGEKGYRLVMEKYNILAVMRQLEDIYLELI